MPRSLIASPPHRLAIAAAIGNALEAFDFAIYGYFANDIGKLFFPHTDPSLRLVASFAVFAVGYLIRPLGGLLLGGVGDLVGRRTMLMLSMVLMGASSVMIGLLPSYASWGASAAYALLLLRMLQGLSFGAEFSGSMTLVAESVQRQRRGFQTAIAAAGGSTGFATGAVVAAVIYNTLSSEAVLQWGWRLPFLMGAAVALLGFWLRSIALPPPAPDQAGAAPASGPAELLRSLWPQRRVFLRVVSIIAFPTVTFYLVVVGLLQVAISRSPQAAGALTGGTAINEAVALAVVLLGGLLSDRYGARRCLRFATLALALLVAPAFLLMQQSAHLAVTLGQLLVLLPQRVIFGAYASILPLQFPAAVRCTGSSLAHGLVAAVLSGTAPLLASWMVLHQGWSWGPAFLALALFPGCFWAVGNLREQHPSAP